MEGNQYPHQERLVFLLQWKSETVDDGSQDLQQFSDAVVPFGFIDEVEENVVDRSSYRGPKVEKFSIDSVEGGLQEIAFSWVLRIEEFQEVQNEELIDVPFGDVCVEIRTLNEPQEELVHYLEMRPGKFQDRLILFGVKYVTGRVHRRGYRTEEVGSELERSVRHDGWVDDNGDDGTYHLHHFGVYVFGDNITLCRDVLQHLVQRLGLDLFPLQLGVGIVKIEKDRALVKFLDEELWALRRRRLCVERGSVIANYAQKRKHGTDP